MRAAWNFRWMMCFFLAYGLLAGQISTAADALESSERCHAVSELKALPVGVSLPVAMGRTLRSGKTRPGSVFTVKTTQRVPVAEDSYLNRGAKVRGEVVASTEGDGTAGHPSVLTLRFTQLSYRGQTVPVVMKAVAMANLMAVDDTFLSMQGGADRGNSNSANWTTRQVGGDEVVRSGWVGPVVGIGLRTVGSADYYGVYSLPEMLQGADGAMVPRAMGVFSTTAKGLYGYDEGARLESPWGLITITNAKGRVVIRAGDHLLLEVVGGR